MPSSLHKTRKQIAKKRNGVPTALHEKSRDSLRLHKASVRDQRLHKLFEARNKKEQPICTAREELLKIKIAALNREYDEGFSIPDVLSSENAKKLSVWEGSWPYLTTIPWVKVSSSGQTRPTDFPTKGLN
ncbi:translation machinery-associated protein 16 [Geosmithia morbida]|uniref:Translation machinery-associated protein 16 n=1 Tax=Geosmithia morbida TaxID=1094350 RepID=A0A9P5D3D7_9HYPO|nr:translation machinery-associated protein 16 [Geosmithia morbida]KAF4126063.1 translation machinery-associated protein 16 [Geosmithia morbida]